MSVEEEFKAMVGEMVDAGIQQIRAKDFEVVKAAIDVMIEKILKEFEAEMQEAKVAMQQAKAEMQVVKAEMRALAAEIKLRVPLH
jgi:hypothetical protein